MSNKGWIADRACVGGSFRRVTIGRHSRIGANVAVSTDIPPNSSVSCADVRVRPRRNAEAGQIV